MKNFTLDIVVPTYNRPKSINYFLNQIKKFDYKRYNFSVSIYDSGTTDETKKIVCENGDSNIFYYRMESSINVDEKTLISVKNSTAEYVLLCGDGIVPQIDKIFDDIDFSLDYELIVIYSGALNAVNRYFLNWDNQTSDAKSEFFKKNYAQITLYGGTICRKDLIRKIDIEEMVKKYNGKGFIYPCSLAIYSSGSFAAYNGNYLISTPYKGSPGWILNGQAVKIWAYNFCWCADSLIPFLGQNSTEEIIKQNGRRTGFFSFKGFVWLRATGNFNFKIYKEYREYLKRTSACSKPLMMIVLLTPQWVCRLIRKIYKLLKQKGQKI